MVWSNASARGAGWSLQLRVRSVQGCENQIRTASINKSTGPVSDCCVGRWVRPSADNTILHLSESETGGVRLLGHQITSPRRPTPGSFASAY